MALQGRFWSDCGCLGVDLGATLGVYVPTLDRFWSSRGRFRSHFGGSWANFGSILDRLGAPCGSRLRRSSDLYRHASLHAHKHASRHTICKQTDDYANKHRYHIQSFNLRPSPEHRHDHRKDPEHRCCVALRFFLQHRHDNEKGPKHRTDHQKHLPQSGSTCVAFRVSTNM